MSDYYEQNNLWDRELTDQEKERIILFSKMIPGDVESILDAGCGSGTLTNSVRGYTITGVDRSRAALKHYQHKQVHGSLDNLLCFDDDSFDLVVCSDVLEHLPVDIYSKTINELKRVSKKYILIISPNNEDLEANQGKCINCSTVFHINYHIRSLGVEAIITLFRDDYAPLVYTYFGEPWSSDPPQKYSLKRSLGKGYKHWENALCPLCGTIQEGDIEYDLETDKLINSGLDGFFNHPTEVMILFACIKAKKKFCDFEMFSSDKNAMLSEKKIPDISVFHRQYIDTSNAAFIKERSHFYPLTSYILKNSENNWIDPPEESPFECCFFGDNGSQFDHALFVIPFLHKGQTLFITYIDIELRETVQVNSYCLERGYIHLLDIVFTGSNESKTVSVVLPDELVPSNEGLQFELLIKGKKASSVPIPFLEFYLDKSPSTLSIIDEKNVDFLEQPYVLTEFANYKPLLAGQIIWAPVESYMYHHHYKCLYWNIATLAEYQHDLICRKVHVKEMVSYKRFLQLNAIQNRLGDRQKELSQGQSKLGEDLGKLGEGQDTLRNELLLSINDIYGVKESVYALSNTVDRLLHTIRHPLKVLFERVWSRKPEILPESLRGKKHLLILTPDVKIDRRTVQMCQSIISRFDIRCTIIAALKDEDTFTNEMLQVKRINPHKTKKYRAPVGAWESEAEFDLDNFYWLHFQYLHMAMEENIDCLMCCDLPVLPAAVYAAKCKSVPLIYDAHELYPEQAIFPENKRELYTRVEREFVAYPDLVITVNDSIAGEMAKRYGIKKPKVILNALDAPDTFDIHHRYNYFREKLPVSEGTKIVLFQGGYSPNRNLDLFVKSAKYLADSNVVLVLMGFGEYQRDLEKIAEKDHMLNHRVFFFPAVDQSVLLHYSASADVGIIPYPHTDLNSYYCTPNKLFEFIQAGLPIIAQDSPELNRFVRENNIGNSRKMESAEDIAVVINNYFSEKKDYRQQLLHLREKICWSVEEVKFCDMFCDVVRD
ncbi:MAG: methyltransferase domain-containing protein [Desulfocapsa sp.]|nr:methyltransferase domain-containing protein [Desulfocapsa sp.]